MDDNNLDLEKMVRRHRRACDAIVLTSAILLVLSVALLVWWMVLALGW